MFTQHYLAKATLTELLYYLIVIENSAKVEFLALNSEIENVTGAQEHYIVIKQRQTALIV